MLPSLMYIPYVLAGTGRSSLKLCLLTPSLSQHRTRICERVGKWKLDLPHKGFGLVNFTVSGSCETKLGAMANLLFHPLPLSSLSSSSLHTRTQFNLLSNSGDLQGIRPWGVLSDKYSSETSVSSQRISRGASGSIKVDTTGDNSVCGGQHGEDLGGVRKFELGRREAVACATFGIGLLLLSSDSKAAEAGGFLNKYLKRKKLDPLDTYVPTVVLAQLQFEDVSGKLVGEKPEFDDARSLLRSGPAGSLRTDIRAVAQYAADAGEGKTATEAVDQCLSALEDLDSLLLRATRSDGSASVSVMKTRISTAVTALDKLLATVPMPILEKGKAIATAYRDQSLPSNEDNLGFDESNDQLKGLL